MYVLCNIIGLQRNIRHHLKQHVYAMHAVNRTSRHLDCKCCHFWFLTKFLTPDWHQLDCNCQPYTLVRNNTWLHLASGTRTLDAQWGTTVAEMRFAVRLIARGECYVIGTWLLLQWSEWDATFDGGTSSSSSFYLPNNTTVCTFARIRF